MKVIFFFLIALGAALYFPQTRPVVLDAAAPVLDPVFRWSTKGEMERIVGDLEQDEQTGRGLPTERGQFQEWIGDTYQGEDSGVDAWGSRYSLQLWPDSFGVVSPGPDMALGTADDLVVAGERSRRRRR